MEERDMEAYLIGMRRGDEEHRPPSRYSPGASWVHLPEEEVDED